MKHHSIRIIILILIAYHISSGILRDDFDNELKNRACKSDILKKFGKPDYISTGPCGQTLVYYKAEGGMSFFSFDSIGNQEGCGWSMGYHVPPEQVPLDSEYVAKSAKEAFHFIDMYRTAFHLRPIEECDSTIRIFYIPSFKAEMLIEIKQSAAGNSFTVSLPEKGSIWIDIWDNKYNKKDEMLSGKIKDTSYLPAIKIRVLDGTSLGSESKQFVDSLFKCRIDSMKSIARMAFDGESIYIESSIGRHLNWFKFLISCYYDNKYNWLGNEVVQVYNKVINQSGNKRKQAREKGSTDSRASHNK
jgi:hypothetical protein